MLAYILRRLAAMIPTLILVSMITFIIIQLPPGDFFTTLQAEIAETGGGQDKEIIKKLQEKYPQVNWIIQGAGPHLTKAGSVSLTDEQVESGEIDALIRGVIW